MENDIFKKVPKTIRKQRRVLARHRISLERDLTKLRLRQLPKLEPDLLAYEKKLKLSEAAIAAIDKHDRVTKEILVWIAHHRTASFASSILMALPRKHRADIQCDIQDDITDMRAAGFKEPRIRFYVFMQFSWAVLRLYGAKFLKLIGVFALFGKLGH